MIIYDVWTKEHFYHRFTDIDLFVNSMLDRGVGRPIGEDTTEWNIYGSLGEFQDLHQAMKDTPGMIQMELMWQVPGSRKRDAANEYQAIGPAGVRMNFIVTDDTN